MSLKGDLSSEERHSVINYLKLRMKDPTDRAKISENNSILIFYFNKYLKLKGFEIQNDVFTKEQIRAKWINWTSAGLSILGSGLIIYNYISPRNGIGVAELAATTASHAIKRTNMLVN